MPVTSAQCIIGTEKGPDAGLVLNYGDDDHSLGYGQIEEAFGALRKNDNTKPYISDQDFRSSNVRVEEVGFNLDVFDMRYHEKFTATQRVNVDFKFDGVVSKVINGYALVLTNELVSICNDGKRKVYSYQVIFFKTKLFSFSVNFVFPSEISLYLYLSYLYYNSVLFHKQFFKFHTIDMTN